MKVVTAVIGAVFVFFGVLLLWELLSPRLGDFPRPGIPFVAIFAAGGIFASPEGKLLTGNLAGLLLALLTALASYHATLRYHERRATVIQR